MNKQHSIEFKFLKMFLSDKSLFILNIKKSRKIPAFLIKFKIIR